MASWFSEGTVTVTNGNAVVAGVGTKFSNCRSGDMFVGPDNGIYQVINPSSDTSVSISPAYRGATSAGAAYGIVPVNGYPKALADAVNLMVQQWGATLSGLGPVASMTTVPVANGGTGATSAPLARTNLGLGSAATKTVGTAAGNIQDVSAPVVMIGNSAFAEVGSHFTAYGDNTTNVPPGGLYWAGMRAQFPFQNCAVDLVGQVLSIGSMNLMFRTVAANGGPDPWRKIYHDGNTTRGSGGVLSAASPIVRIANVADTTRLDLQETTFEPVGGWGVANDQAQGVAVERLGVGEYRITGCLGLALEGWRTHDPVSPDGGRMLGITDSRQYEDGAVTVRLFKQRWTLTDDGEMVSGPGAPIDVPLNSWIDVRLEMPAIEYPSPPPPLPATTEE